MKLFIFIKPNGIEITVSDRPENIDYAKSLGWKLKEEEQDKESDVEPGEDVEEVEPTPGPQGKGVDVKVPDGTGTTLYTRMEGEMIEGQETPEEVIIVSDLFPNELVEKKLKEGWFKTEEEAGNAPPDKPKGN